MLPGCPRPGERQTRREGRCLHVSNKTVACRDCGQYDQSIPATLRAACDVWRAIPRAERDGQRSRVERLIRYAKMAYEAHVPIDPMLKIALLRSMHDPGALCAWVSMDEEKVEEAELTSHRQHALLLRLTTTRDPAQILEALSVAIERPDGGLLREEVPLARFVLRAARQLAEAHRDVLALAARALIFRQRLSEDQARLLLRCALDPVLNSDYEAVLRLLSDRGAFDHLASPELRTSVEAALRMPLIDDETRHEIIRLLGSRVPPGARKAESTVR